MTNPITITLSPDEALVLQEFFARFAESNDFSLSHNSEFIAFVIVDAVGQGVSRTFS